VDDAAVTFELVRKREPGVPRRDQHMAERAVSADLEAAVDRVDAIDVRQADPVVPGCPLTQRLHVIEKSLDAGVVAVADAADERNDRPPTNGIANGQPRKRRGQAVAVALRAHLTLPDGFRPATPGRGRVGVGREDDDLGGLDPAVQERRVGDEAGQPTTDDRGAHHFTEPARSPCTK
jgi:hypothetical protein